MVQKNQNEISPIFYCRKKLKTLGKLLKLPYLQPRDWGQPYWMTLYNAAQWWCCMLLFIAYLPMATTRNTILTQQSAMSPRHCFHLKCPKCVFRQFFGQCFWVSIFSTDKCQTSRISRGRVSLSRRYLLVYNNINAIGWIHTIMIFPPHLTTHSDAPAMIGWSCQGNLHSAVNCCYHVCG